MPRFLRLFFLLNFICILFFFYQAGPAQGGIIAWALTPTPARTIKFQILPIPTRTPTKTPTPSISPTPGGGGLNNGGCHTIWVTDCRKSCNKPGGRCGTGGTGAALYWCRHIETVCDPIQPPVQPPPVLPSAITSVCTDSDGGQNIFIKGITTVGTTSHGDNCINSQNTEFFCKPDGTVGSVIAICSAGCTLGACIRPSPTIAVPTAIPTQAQSANSIIDIVNQITSSCGAIYGPNQARYTPNLNCVYKMNFPSSVDQRVKEELYLSAFSQGWLQCVGFVRASVARNGTPWAYVSGHAIDYASTAKPAGYTFVRKNAGIPMQVNDIPIWNYDTVGHIAYTTRVFDSVNFQVAEANYGCGSGCAIISNKVTTEPALIGWLRKV